MTPVDPRARELAEKLVTILNTTTDSHAVIVVTATLRGALAAAWREGFDRAMEHAGEGEEPEWDDAGENPFKRGCV